MSNHGSGNKFVYALQEYSIPLLMGVVVAMLMANLMPDLYHTIVHDTLSLVTGESADHVAATAPDPTGHVDPTGHLSLIHI